MKRIWIAGLTLLLGLSNACWAQERVRVSGTGSGTGTLQRLAEAFTKEQPGVQVEVQQAIGSSGGIAALLDGRLELALSNRPPNEKELARGPLRVKQYAVTPFVMVVGPGVKLRSLSGAELAALYAPGAAQYPDGQRARAILRLSDAIDTALIKSIGPEVAAAVDGASQRPGMLDAATDSAAADLIERTPGSFGASTLALILSEGRRLTPLTINGVEPNVVNLEAGRYLLSKKLFHISAAQPSAGTQKLIDFIASPSGQRLLAANGHSTK